MIHENFERSSLARLRWVGCIILLAFCGSTVYVTCCHCQRAVFLANEKEGVIRSLARSVATTDEGPWRVRVAIFDAGLDNGSTTRKLTRIVDAESRFSWKFISSADVQAEALDEFDVVVVPGGSGSEQATILGKDGKRSVREFVKGGGGYVGICGGAFLATAKYDWSLALVNAKTLTGEIEVPGIGSRSVAMRGAGTVKVELTDAGKKVFGSYSSFLNMKYGGGPILSPAGMANLPEYVSLAVFRTEVWEYEAQRGTMINTSAIIAGRFGKGHVILFSPHPEMTQGLEPLVRRAIMATGQTSSSRADPK